MKQHIKLQGITRKLFLITFIVLLLFFVIMMIVHIALSANIFISESKSIRTAKKMKIEQELMEAVLSQEELPELETGLLNKIKFAFVSDLSASDQSNQYRYDIMAMLHEMRFQYSDNDILCEFGIVGPANQLLCVLQNELVIRNAKVNKEDEQKNFMFLEMDPIPDERLFAAMRYLEARPQRRQPDIYALVDKSVMRERRYQPYLFEVSKENIPVSAYDQTEAVWPYETILDARDLLAGKEIELFQISRGKYDSNFIDTRVNELSYFKKANENRRALITAIQNGAFDAKSEKESIWNAHYYDVFDLGEGYKVVLRSQLDPVESVLYQGRVTYFILALIMVLFSLTLSSIFFRIIVKPVRKIEEKARKLAVLDFSHNSNYRYHRKDEIGSLYESISSLAFNLKNAITELQNKNKALEKDIEKERELEGKRREFIAVTSHELKTPLARIRGYAEALDLNLSEEKKAYYCKSLMGEVDIMNQLILEMLSLSKLESQDYNDLDIEEINLYDLTEVILERSQQLLIDKKIDLTISADAKELNCKGDCMKIERVITNFIDNAIHYTPEGKGIEVQLRDFGNKIYFEIENQGSHIEDEVLPHIWDSFYKADKVRTKSKKSVTAERTGLGLSIVRAILDLHKSRYGVKNTDGGVAFYFELDK